MKRIILLLAACWACLSGQAGSLPFEFVPNQGQWPRPVRFAADVPGGRLFAEQNGFTYSLLESGPDDHHDLAKPVRGHAFRVRLLGARPNAELAGEDRRAAYHNYLLGNDPKQWATGVPLFGGLRYRQLYPGVDLRWHTQQGRLKYDYELAPGVDPAVIRLSYEGLEELKIVDGELRMRTSVGTLAEEAPVAWQTAADGRRRPVACRFRLRGTELSFELGRLDPKLPLTIDPALIFSTYSGTTGGLSANVALADGQGQMYTAGYVITPPYPTTVGAFQTSPNGFSNMGISKLNAAGTGLLYATYLGGSGSEYPLDAAVTPAGELVLLALTSSVNYPLPPTGGFDRTPGLQQNYAISRLSADGRSLLASTYLGGDQNEGGSLSSIPSTVLLAPNGDVIVGGVTSSSNFPTLNGFQNVKPGGPTPDGFVTCLDANLTTLRWSTYLGGSATDQVHDLRRAADGSIYVCGQTNSFNFPVGPGGLMPALQGNLDGFVLRLSADGSSRLNGTYLGTTAIDAARFLDIDANGMVLVAGATTADYPVSPGAFSPPAAPNSERLFVHSLAPTLGSTTFSTQLALSQGGFGLSSFQVTGFGLDECGRILFSAYTNLPSCPLTADALPGGPRTLYLGVLSPDARTLLYGSYFGGPQFSGTHLHYAASNQITRQGDLYHVECTTSPNFPTTPGALSPGKRSMSNDGASFKFSLATVASTPLRAAVPAVGPGCAPYRVQFANNSTGASGYSWNFGDGSPASTDATPQHLFLQPGRYRVRLEAQSLVTCSGGQGRDTTSIVVEVNGPAATENRRDSLDCLQERQLDAGPLGLPGGTYAWSTGATSRTIVVRAAGTYSVLVPQVGGCAQEIRFAVHQARALPEVQRLDSLQCGGSVVLDAGAAADRYLWSTGEQTRTIRVQEPGRYRVELITPGCPPAVNFTVTTVRPGLVPNIILPVGDNQANRAFTLPNQLRGAELRVFNRWGREVFHAARYANDWRGGELPAGTYYYEARLPNCGNRNRGWLEIMR
ncbi:gliding motility-associated C-terminal domain-containing protein [Hymenobacter sp. B81]|uniref:DUF7948 domain-containing protein n=1 Tax=Hymenobacter sp. B81 TaxID=3344878 RepID=UPI0037DDCB5D